MIHLLSIREGIIEILSLRTSAKKSAITLPDSLSAFFETLVFPRVELRAIRKVFDKGNCNIKDVLLENNFSFTFNPQILETLINMTEFIRSDTEFYARYVFYTYISWFIEFNEENDEHFILILKAINSICSHKNYANYQIQRQIAISIFYFTYQIMFKAAKINTMRSYLPILNDYFLFSGELPEKCFDLLTITANHLQQLNQEATYQLEPILFTVCDSLLIEKTVKFPIPVVKSILQVAWPFFPLLFTSALNFFLHSIQFIDDEKFISAYVDILPQGILKMVGTLPIQLQIPKNLENIEVNFQSQKQSIIYRCLPKPTFDQLLKIEEPIFPENMFYKEMISTEVYLRSNLIISILLQKEYVSNCFINACQPYLCAYFEYPHIYDAYAVFLFILTSKNESRAQYNFHFEFLYNIVLFNPMHTIFNDFQGYKIINTLRNYAFQLIYQDDGRIIRKILSLSAKTPYLFAEIIFRIIKFNNPFPTPSYVDSYSRGLLDSLLLYQSLENLDEKQLEAVNVARSVIMYFFNIFMPKSFFGRKLVSYFFNNSHFIKNFMVLIFEDALRPLVLDNMVMFFTSTNGTLNKELLDTILIVISSAALNFDSRSIQLLTDILNSFNNILTKVDSIQLANGLEKAGIIICQQLHQIPLIKESKLFLSQLIRFFALITCVHHLTVTEAETLRDIIKKLYCEEIPESLEIELVSLIAGHIIENKEPNFVIKQTKGVFILLEIYSRMPKLDQWLYFVTKLCSYSYVNSIVLHEDEIDILILNYIDVWRTGDTASLPKDIIDMGLILFQMIASRISSPAVVQKYISLLCPLESSFLSNAHHKLLSTIDSLLKITRSIPKVTIPSNGTSSITITGLSFTNLQHEFTFSLWYFPDISPYHPKSTLFRISDTADISVSIEIIDNMFSIRYHDSELQLSFTIPEKIKIHVWHFLNFRFTSKGVDCYAGLKLLYSLNLNKPFRFKKNQFIVTINEQQKVPNYYASIGSFALYQHFSKSEIDKLYQDPRSFYSSSLQPYFSYIPQKTASHYTLKEMHSNKNVTYHMQTNKIKQSSTFSDILFEFYRIEVMLPIFAQLDFTLKDGSRIDKHLQLGIDILKGAFMLSQDIQDSFYRASGFKIIAHLLKASDSMHSTYNYYQEFLSMIDSRESLLSIVDPNLKKQLLSSIILDIELWIRSPYLDQYKILKSWNKILTKTCHDDLISILTFQQIIHSLRYYYWFENVEDVYLERSDIKVPKCRTQLLSLAYKIAKNKFTSSEFESLIKTIITLEDIKQIPDFLKLLLRIINSGIVPSSFNVKYYIDILTEQINLNNTEITYQIFQVIISAFNNNLIGAVTLADYLSEIPDFYNNCFLDKHLLFKFCKLAHIPEMLSFISWMSLSMGNKMIKKVIPYFKPSANYNINDSSEDWLIALIFINTNKQIRKRLINFLVLSFIDCWKRIYDKMGKIGERLNKDSSPIKHQFLIQILKLEEIPKIDDVALIIKNYLFFQSRPFVNKALSSHFETSIYDIDEKLEDLIDCKPVFGLRISPDEKWEDADIAIECYKFFDSINYSDLMTLVFYFLKREGRAVEFPKDYAKYPSNEKELINQFTNNHYDLKAGFLYFEHIQDTYIPVFNNDVDLSVHSVVPKHSFFDETEYFDFIRQCDEKKCTNKQLWSHTWRSLAIEMAPWNRSLPSEARNNVHFKRDFTLCVSACPYKLRRNFKFNDHLDASFTRDSGNLDLAKTRLEHYRKLILARQKTPEILDVDTFHSSEKKVNQALQTPSKFLKKYTCELIRISRTYNSFLTLFSDRMIIEREMKSSITLLISKIVNIMPRTYMHKLTAVEIFTEISSYFINFSEEDSLVFFNHIKSYLPHNMLHKLKFSIDLAEHKYTEQWKERKLTNFEYLMKLNMHSSRSFHSASQYPIFPWVLIDYTSQEIDLNDESVYRDLSKPMGAMDEQRYKELKRKFKEFHKLGIVPYLYSSGLICPLSLFLWLIRVEPFTTMHISVQGKMFDKAARLFYSIGDSFRLTSSHMNDFRELIPEFFFMPEFLINENGFDLGDLSGNVISDVILPKWAKSPYEFIYLHRKALESEYVSQHLNEWIDLIWGVKQGAPDNLYKHEMYESIWEDPTSMEPERKEEIEAIMQSIGQIPTKLFNESHIKRDQATKKEAYFNRPTTIQILYEDIFFSFCPMLVDNKILIRVVNYHNLVRVCYLDINKLSQLSQSEDTTSIKSYEYDQQKGEYQEILLSNDYFNIEDLINQKKPLIGSSLTQNELILVGYEGNDIHTISQASKEAQHVHDYSTDIVCIGSMEKWVAVSGKDAIVHIFCENFTEPVNTIHSYCNIVKCLQISAQFDLMVCGTKDGSLLLCSLNRGSIERIINLEGWTISRILITNSWGFILVYKTKMEHSKTIHSLSIFNVNGNQMQDEQILDCGIISWNTWSNDSSFDYIILADEKGRIFWFEAFYLNLGKYIYRSNEQILEITFLNDISNAVVVTKPGRIILIPIVDI